MEIICPHEHLQCFHFDSTEKSTIELVRIAKGVKGDLHIRNNEVVFFMEGGLRFIFNDFPDCEGMKGQVLFLPAGGQYLFQALASTVMMVFRLYDPIRLCDNFSLENLYGGKKRMDEHLPRTHNLNILSINTRIWHFLNGINDCLSDGIRCRSYFDLKIKEFFLILRIYYSKEDIYDFLFLILSKDTAFSEYVRLRWHHYRSVVEIAESMRLTPRQFSSKFKAVFGQTPYRWMQQRRAKSVHNQLSTTEKPIKQIAFENGFGNISQFSKFCKTELGKWPTEVRAGKNYKIRNNRK